VLAAMQQRRGCSFAYSGTILVQDEPGHYSKQPNFDGPTAAVIPENRELKVLDPLDVDRLLQLDNYITSNSWIARRELLDEKLLQDPDLVVREDVLLLLAFLDKTSFAFTWRPTAQWHRRSSTQDNPTVHKHQYTADYVRRLTLRFKFSRWDAPHVERKLRIPTPESFPLPPPSPPLPATPSLALQKIEKMYFAASGVKRTLCDPKRWPKRLWTACKIIRQRGIKGVLAHSAEIGRPDIADR